MIKNLEFAIDSGAHSLYNRSMKGKESLTPQERRAIDLSSFYSTEQVDRYLEAYSGYCKKYPDAVFHVTLDVIFNPKLTWDFFKRLQGLGVSPLPVIHYGTDVYWIKKYMGECEYLGLGGLGGDVNAREYGIWADSAWKILTDSKRRPIKKVHGFAVTSYRHLSYYPWASVDSTTSLIFSRYGGILLPKLLPCGSYDYLSSPFVFPVTDRRRLDRKHVAHKGERTTAAFNAYLESIGFSLEDAVTRYEVRDAINLYYSLMQQEALNKEKDSPVKIFLSGNFSNSQIRLIFHQLGGLVKGKDFYYLGTFWQKGYLGKVIREFEEYRRESNCLKPKPLTLRRR